jgi:hypothetical protein
MQSSPDVSSDGHKSPPIRGNMQKEDENEDEDEDEDETSEPTPSESDSSPSNHSDGFQMDPDGSPAGEPQNMIEDEPQLTPLRKSVRSVRN